MNERNEEWRGGGSLFMSVSENVGKRKFVHGSL
jgi:hypothetical protein